MRTELAKLAGGNAPCLDLPVTPPRLSNGTSLLPSSDSPPTNVLAFALVMT